MAKLKDGQCSAGGSSDNSAQNMKPTTIKISEGNK